MAKRGRKETPAELKILRGTRKDRVPAAKAEAPRSAPTRPAYLEGDAAEAWEWIVGLLMPTRRLTELDALALANLAQLAALARSAQRELDLNAGCIAETALGGDKSHPAAQLLISATAQMNKLLCEFGMTPASRSSMGNGGEAAKDELNEFISRKA